MEKRNNFTSGVSYNCVEKSTGKRNISCLFFLCQTPYILFLTEIPVFIRFLQLYIVHHHEITVKLKYIYTLQINYYKNDTLTRSLGILFSKLLQYRRLNFVVLNCCYYPFVEIVVLFETGHFENVE